MDRSVALMPAIRDRMRAIGERVDRMGQDVGGMRGTTASMDGRMDDLNTGVLEMSMGLRGLNRSVAEMGGTWIKWCGPIP
jgi:hypothetical protein